MNRELSFDTQNLPRKSCGGSLSPTTRAASESHKTRYQLDSPSYDFIYGGVPPQEDPLLIGGIPSKDYYRDLQQVVHQHNEHYVSRYQHQADQFGTANRSEGRFSINTKSVTQEEENMSMRSSSVGMAPPVLPDCDGEG